MQCTPPSEKKSDFPGREEAEMKVSADSFVMNIDGKTTKLYKLENKNGMVVTFTNIGASIVQVIVPDRDGNFDDVALGYKTVEEYLANPMYNGCIVGRYGNRIGKGKFELNGKTYQLNLNDGENTLHGGPGGFHLAYWDGQKKDNSIVFHYVSSDMEEGYPGELSTTVTYTLTDDNEIKIEYLAESTDSTVVNLTNHTYWNLDGEAKGDILGHELKIPAEYITPVDNTLIPDGSFMEVENTPFDFREFHKIGERINADDQQVKFGLGYDHNFVLAREDSEELHTAAILKSEKTGRVMEVSTTEPGIQFYSGNFMNGSLSGKNGNSYSYRYALALETQHFPDSPNKENFPSTLLVPGEKYHSVTIYKFTTSE